MSSISIPSELESQVKTAAEFLNDLYQKGYEDADLRKYLVQTRGLSVVQVDKAFEIHHNKIKKKNNVNSYGKKAIATGQPILERKMSDNADRPEKVTKELELKDDAMFFLIPKKREEGLKLLKDFLTTEKNYCTILGCLSNEYHKGLAKIVDLGRLQITRKEVDEIFKRIPELLRFHQMFHEDIKEGVGIGRKFVRLIDFFKSYADYLKDCTSTVQTMRKYTRDRQLTKSLGQIKANSNRKKDDMVDLLLVPLDRITDYRDFLDTLYRWADKKQKLEHEFLGKAARRIGRIANYVEQYKYAISNRNEMNKVQSFLGHQCDILIPKRRIVRRGMIVRRTTGWMGRNKHYIFFLFNDVLLWTTRKGDLQNVVQLRKCSLYKSDSKINPSKKLKIVVDRTGHRQKILLLECEYKRQRDDWWNALDSSIEDCKNSIEKGWSKGEVVFELEQNSDKGEDESTATTVVNSHSPNNKQDENKTLMSDEPGQYPEESYDERYEHSFNFALQEFDEIEAMDEAASEISEYDREFFEKYNKYQKGSMSPFRRSSSDNISSPVNGISLHKNSLKRKAVNHSLDSEVISSPGKSSIIRRQNKPSETSSPGHKSSIKISRKNSGNITDEKDCYLERTSSFRIRLNDCEQ